MNGVRMTISASIVLSEPSGPVIGDAGRLAAVVAVDAVAHRAGDQLEVAGRVGLGQHGDQHARLRADVAAEAPGRSRNRCSPAGPLGLRDDRARRRERVIAELLASPSSNRSPRLIATQRRQRIFAPARRLEHVAAVDLASLQIAGLARHAELVFGPIVIRLELGVAQRPVGERGVLRIADAP